MTDEKSQQYTILVLCLPAYGHLTPMCSLINEIISKNKNVKVIFFGNAEHRHIIEKAKADFRPCKVEIVDPNKSINDLRHDFPLADMMTRYMNIADEMMPKYLKVVEEENVDLVIHDFSTVWARWFLEYMQIAFAKKQLKRKPPQSIMVSASVLFDPRVYPGASEAQFFPKQKFSLWSTIIMLIFQLKYWLFYYKHGFKYRSPMDILVFGIDKINLCGMMPEFHPRSHLFSKSIKFMGNFVSEDLRQTKGLDEPLKSFLEPFEAKNPLPLTPELKLDEKTVKDLDAQPKLIYASFGTLANQDMKAYNDIIEAVKTFDQESNKSGIKASQLRLLVSVGEKSYAKFKRMIDNKELQLPENILIMDKVPQLDVLKRASLFITHSGQGSTNEAIHYGVPMICVPVIGDQPLVAYRAADELGLGIRIPVDDIDHGKVRKAIAEIFDDKAYLERTLIFSKLSAKHKGLKDSSDFLIALLQESKKSKKD